MSRIVFAVCPRSELKRLILGERCCEPHCRGNGLTFCLTENWLCAEG